MPPEVKLRYIITDEGTIRVLDKAGKQLGVLGREAVKAGDKGSKSLGKMRSSLGKLSGVAGKATAAIAALGVGVTAGLKGALQTADDITKLARASGTSVEKLSSLRTAADLSGTSIGKLGKGLGLLNRRLVEAASGTGRAGNVFAALRVEFEDSEGQLRGNIAVLKDVAAVFKLLPDGPQKTAAAMELFGKSGGEFINLLDLGAKGISALQAENKKLGLTFDKTFGEQAEAVNDNIARLSLAATGLATVFAAAVTPALVEASEGLLEFLGIADSAGPGGKLGELIREQNRITASDPRNRRGRTARLAEIEREIADLRAGATISAAVRGVRDNLGLDDTAPSGFDVDDMLSKLARIADETKRVGDRGGPVGAATGGAVDDVKALKSEIDALQSSLQTLDPIAEQASRTIDIDLGGAFRRLTTGGNGFDFLDGLQNATQAAAADVFDAILGEKLSFDIAIEKNFAEDIPGFFADGMDSVLSIFKGTTSELGSEATRSAKGIAQAYGTSFSAVGAAGQGLSSTLDGLDLQAFNRVGAGRSVSVATDAFGSRFSGPGSGVFAAGSAPQPGVPSGGSGSGLAGGLLVAGGLAGFATTLIGELSRKEERRVGLLTATVDAPVGVSNLGVAGGVAGAAVGVGAGLVGGATLGASLGSVVPIVGTIVGAVIGAVAGLIINALASKPSQGDLIGRGLLGGPFKENPLLSQQHEVLLNGRTGIAAEALFEAPASRFPLLESLGLGNLIERNGKTVFVDDGGRGILDPSGIDRFADDTVVRFADGSPGDKLTVNGLRPLLDLELSPELIQQALAVSGVLSGGSQENQTLLFNTIANNSLLNRIEFDAEIKRQNRGILEASGVSRSSALEQLAFNFNRSQQRALSRTGSPQRVGPDRSDFIRDAAAVIDLFSEGTPKGVNILKLVEKNTGQTSVNMGVLLKEIDRQTEIFQTLADTLDSSLKGGIGAAFAAETPQQVFDRTLDRDAAARQSRRGGSGFVSSIAVNIQSGITTAITEGVFDAIKDTPAWDALTQQIADAVNGGVGFGAIPGLVGNLFNASLPEIEAAQIATNRVNELFGTTPTSLSGRAEALFGAADNARFGRLSPEAQRDELLRKRDVAGNRLFSLIAGGGSPGDIASAFESLGGIGTDLAGLTDQLFDTGTLTGRRKADVFFQNAIGLVDSAATGINNLGDRQLEMLTTNTEAIEGNASVTIDNTSAMVDLTDKVELMSLSISEIVTIVASGKGPGGEMGAVR